MGTLAETAERWYTGNMAINLDTLAQDLEDLFVRSCELSLECQALILDAGADILDNEVVMTPDSGLWNNFIVGDEEIVWLFPESLDWSQEMPVPFSVLKGELSVKEWAADRIQRWHDIRAIDAEEANRDTQGEVL